MPFTQISSTTWKTTLLGGEVEVGDVTSATFKPHVRLKRWDGECEIGFSFPTALINNIKSLKNRQSPFAELVDGKLVWNGGTNYEIRFYELAASERTRNKLGGFEFELVLKKKPPINSFSFAVDTKNLVWSYQPPLTEELKVGENNVVTLTETDAYDKDGKVLTHRPDYAVGSYVIYHATRGKIHSNSTDAEKYKTGKWGTFYRPKATDAFGNSTWLTTSLIDNQMTLTLDQSWLDNAVYPVIIDPDFGYTDIGETESTISGDGRFYAYAATAASAGPGTSISIYLRNSSESERPVKLALYGPAVSYSTSYWENGDAGTVTLTSLEEAWKTGNFVSTPEIWAQAYLLAFAIQSASYVYFHYDTLSTARLWNNSDIVYYSFPRTTESIPNYETRDVSIYCTYTASGYVPPTVSTSDCTDVTGLSATGNGNITNTGGENCERRGFCYMLGTSGDPTVANSVAYDDGDFGTGVYTKSITSLSLGTGYRVRAYAKNSAGIGYGTTVQLTTATPTITQEGFRFRNDDGDEDGATWIASQDVSINRDIEIPTRLRILLDTADTPFSTQFKLHVSKDSGAWAAVLPTPGATAFATASVSGTTSGAGRTNNGTLIIPLPSSWAANQLAILVLYSDQGSGSAPTNWNQITGSPFGTATPKLQIFWKILEGAEINPETTISGSTSGASHCAAMALYNNVDQITPVEVIGAASVGTGSPMTAASIDTLTDGAIVLGIWGRGDNESSASHTLGESATGINERFDSGTSEGNDSQVGLFDKVLSSYGSSGAMSSTTSATDPWVAILIALKPAAPEVILSLSDNIGAGGTTDTTYQLTAPGAKSTSDFDAGKISDDTNPLPSVSIGTDEYTEVEFCIELTSAAELASEYSFKITRYGTDVDTYSVTPIITYATGGAEEYIETFSTLLGSTSGKSKLLNKFSIWKAALALKLASEKADIVKGLTTSLGLLAIKSTGILKNVLTSLGLNNIVSKLTTFARKLTPLSGFVSSIAEVFTGAAGEYIKELTSLLGLSAVSTRITSILRFITSYCLQFNGTSSYVNCGNDADFDLTDAGTIEANVFLQGTPNTYGIIAGKTGSDYFYYLFVQDESYAGTGNRMMLASIKDSGGYKQVELGIPELNTWYHLALVWDGTHVTGYLNGIQSQQIDGGACLSSPTDNITFGGPTGSRWFQGLIDDVRVYNVNKLPATILNHANNIFNDEDGIVGQWNCNEGSGGIATDSSGQSHDGTIYNASWYSGGVSGTRFGFSSILKRNFGKIISTAGGIISSFVNQLSYIRKNILSLDEISLYFRRITTLRTFKALLGLTSVVSSLEQQVQIIVASLGLLAAQTRTINMKRVCSSSIGLLSLFVKGLSFFFNTLLGFNTSRIIFISRWLSTVSGLTLTISRLISLRRKFNQSINLTVSINKILFAVINIAAALGEATANSRLFRILRSLFANIGESANIKLSFGRLITVLLGLASSIKFNMSKIITSSIELISVISRRFNLYRSNLTIIGVISAFEKLANIIYSIISSLGLTPNISRAFALYREYIIEEGFISNTRKLIGRTISLTLGQVISVFRGITKNLFADIGQLVQISRQLVLQRVVKPLLGFIVIFNTTGMNIQIFIASLGLGILQSKQLNSLRVYTTSIGEVALRYINISRSLRAVIGLISIVSKSLSRSLYATSGLVIIVKREIVIIRNFNATLSFVSSLLRALQIILENMLGLSSFKNFDLTKSFNAILGLLIVNIKRIEIFRSSQNTIGLIVKFIPALMKVLSANMGEAVSVSRVFIVQRILKPLLGLISTVVAFGAGNAIVYFSTSIGELATLSRNINMARILTSTLGEITAKVKFISKGALSVFEGFNSASIFGFGRIYNAVSGMLATKRISLGKNIEVSLGLITSVFKGLVGRFVASLGLTVVFSKIFSIYRDLIASLGELPILSYAVFEKIIQELMSAVGLRITQSRAVSLLRGSITSIGIISIFSKGFIFIRNVTFGLASYLYRVLTLYKINESLIGFVSVSDIIGRVVTVLATSLGILPNATRIVLSYRNNVASFVIESTNSKITQYFRFISSLFGQSVLKLRRLSAKRAFIGVLGLRSNVLRILYAFGYKTLKFIRGTYTLSFVEVKKTLKMLGLIHD